MLISVGYPSRRETNRVPRLPEVEGRTKSRLQRGGLFRLGHGPDMSEIVRICPARCLVDGRVRAGRRTTRTVGAAPPSFLLPGAVSLLRIEQPCPRPP